MIENNVLNRSMVYIEKGQFEKAQIILRHALNENPNHAKALELFGDLALKLGRADEAMQRYEHASNNYTNNNQYAEAIICMEKIAQIDKTNREIFSRLADLYRFYGLPNRAIDTILTLCTWAIDNKEDAIFISGLRKIIELQPKNFALHLSFAKTLISLNRTQEAEDELKKLKSLAEEARDDHILEEINKLMPQHDGGEELDPKSRIELGNLLYEIGSKDEAIIEFEKAVSDLIKSNEIEEAINVLNRIVEINPDNTKARDKIKELQGEQKAEEPQEEGVEAVSEEAVEETTEEGVPESKAEEIEQEGVPTEKIEEGVETPEPESVETVSSESEQGLETFQDLSEEIEGFIAATESAAKEEAPAETQESEPAQAEEAAKIEGQIADIEFLLKETEEPTAPSFEIAREFDEFRSAVIWQEEDVTKRLDLAKMAFDAGLYETVLSYVSDIKANRKTWPLSLEIHGGSLVKLGRYNEARNDIAPSLLLEEIPEDQKTELRYLLASAYEGMGDFDNALKEIERIMSSNPNYKDVKEIYSLLTGKELVHEEPREIVEEKPPVTEVVPPPEPVPPAEETYPTIIEEEPSAREEKTPEKLPEEKVDVEEKKGENITFL